MDVLVLEGSEILLHLYVEPVDLPAECGDGGTHGRAFVSGTGALLSAHFREGCAEEVCLLLGVGDGRAMAERYARCRGLLR